MTSEPGRVPAVVLSWALRVTRLVAAACEDLTGAYLHGSAVLGGWQPGRSDVDVLFVTGGDLAPARLSAVADVLLAVTSDCPGSALECSVVTAREAGQPSSPWPYLLHVNAGASRARVVLGNDSPGDPDLLMHYTVCRAAGWPLRGPAPAKLFGRVPRQQILRYLAGELTWGLGHAPEQYSVLNACRTLLFAADGSILSKLESGAIALNRNLGPPAVIQRALDQQRGLVPPQSPAADATAFVEAVAADLRAASPSATERGRPAPGVGGPGVTAPGVAAPGAAGPGGPDGTGRAERTG